MPAFLRRQWSFNGDILVPLLRPLAFAGSFVAVGTVVVWVFPGVLDSIDQRALHRAAVHPDHSVVDTHVVAAFSTPKALIYRDVNGTLHRILTDETELNRFVNSTLIYLDTTRDENKAEAQGQIDALIDNAFSDGQACLARYADWYFEWGRSWSFAKETVIGGVKGLGVNNVQGFSEAARNEVEAYLVRNYVRFVLKPELRNPVIEAGIPRILAQAHLRYLNVLTSIDDRIQQFLAQYTRHLEVIDPLAKVGVSVDWDAQKWKTPRYAADDEAFRAAFRGVAVSTLIAGTVGPAVERAIAQAFVTTATRVVAGLQPEIYGLIAGSVAEPGAGSLAGWFVGGGTALLIDYISNRQRERLDRGEFLQVNADALKVTTSELSRALQRDLLHAVDVWFDDTRAIAVEQNLGRK